MTASSGDSEQNSSYLGQASSPASPRYLGFLSSENGKYPSKGKLPAQTCNNDTWDEVSKSKPQCLSAKHLEGKKVSRQRDTEMLLQLEALLMLDYSLPIHRP